MPMARYILSITLNPTRLQNRHATPAPSEQNEKMNLLNFPKIRSKKLSLSTMGLIFLLYGYFPFSSGRSKKFATVPWPDCRSPAKNRRSKTEMAKAAKSRTPGQGRDRAFCRTQGFLPGRRADRVVSTSDEDLFCKSANVAQLPD